MSILFVKRYGQLIIIVAVLGLYIFTKMQLSVCKANLATKDVIIAQYKEDTLQLKKYSDEQAAKLAQARKLADENAQKAAKELELEKAINYGRTCEEAFKKGVERGLILQEKER